MCTGKEDANIQVLNTHPVEGSGVRPSAHSSAAPGGETQRSREVLVQYPAQKPQKKQTPPSEAFPPQGRKNHDSVT